MRYKGKINKNIKMWFDSIFIIGTENQSIIINVILYFRFWHTRDVDRFKYIIEIVE